MWRPRTQPFNFMNLNLCQACCCVERMPVAALKHVDPNPNPSTPRTQPFNFPLEIPALQVLGALFMGNKPLVHVDHRCVSPPPDRAKP